MTHLLIGLILLAAASSAAPCEVVCVTPKPKQLLNDHQFVMIGRVKEARWRDRSNGTFTVTAIRVWKGDKKHLVLETTQGGSSTCGYSMEEGKVYVVYADTDPQEIAICDFAPIPSYYAKEMIRAFDRARRLPALSLPAEDLKPPDSRIPR